MTRSLLLSLFDDVERRPLTVSELTSQVRGALENRFASVWVEGEISNFKAHTSGHWYFTIKDEGAQLRATCFRGINRAIRFRRADARARRGRFTRDRAGDCALERATRGGACRRTNERDD